MVYQAVLFDMDGVVVDTELSVAEFWQELAQAEGFSLSEDDLDRHVYGRSAEHTLRLVFPQISADRYDEVYSQLRENNQSLRYLAIAGATELLRQLNECRVPLALVTGAQHWKAAAVLGQLNLDETFDVQVRAEDVDSGKPDPACYLLAAQRLGVGIDRCVVFEDAVSGVASAVAAGATCVALAAPHREARVREAGATAVARDFRDVTFRARDRLLCVDADTAFPFAASRMVEPAVPAA